MPIDTIREPFAHCRWGNDALFEVVLTLSDEQLDQPFKMGEFFAAHPPCTTMVKVRRLIDPAMLIEIEADAVVTRPH
jgi:enamine deaminase RidA (YjgF/YER057c/UK114 family)